MKKVALGVAVIAALAYQALAVDGFAVSTAFTKACERSAGGGWRGSIVRFDIENSRVVKCDTLNHSRNGVSHWPCISFDGKMVVFFRDGDTFDNGTKTSGTKDFITVMNKDGSGKKDLVEFTGTEASNQWYKSGYDRLMDWPVGDWIFYTQPQTSKIWKVNYKTGAKEYVLNYGVTPFLRRWNLSADGTRSANTHGSQCATFPDNKNISQDAGGCNLCLSASGRFTSFFGGRPCRVGTDLVEEWKMKGHSSFNFGDWNWKTGYVNRDIGYCQEDFVNLNLCAKWMGRDSIGRGLEIIRWAVNSDKWVLHHDGWKGWAGNTSAWGSNQLLYNWADLEIIMTSNNPPNTGTDANTVFCNMAGDFWIKPPKDEYVNTHFETIYGTWLPLGTYPEGPIPKYDTIPWHMKRDGVASRHVVRRAQTAAPAIAINNNKNLLQFSKSYDALMMLYSATGKKVFASGINGKSAFIPANLKGALIVLLQANEKVILKEKIILH